MKKMKKRTVSVVALAVVLSGCAVLGGKYASAAVTSDSFDFIIYPDGKADSNNVQKTVSEAHATVKVTTYKNTTNTAYLRVRVRRSSTNVTDFCRVSSTGDCDLYYYSDEGVTTGQSFVLRGRLSGDATYGYGRIAGTWTP